MNARSRDLLWSLAAFLVGGVNLGVMILHKDVYHGPVYAHGIVFASIIVIWGILRLVSWSRSN